jgi:serine/threonine protein kinase
MDKDSESRQLFISIIERQSAADGINGRYYDVCRLDGNAGHGNFSLLFKANDRSSGSRVALKFFHPLERDEYRIKCFRRESVILQSLCGQPNILRLVEPRSEYVIRMTHQPTGLEWPLTLEFMTTELADGNIEQYIYEMETAPMKNLLYFREMCKAVQRIHANGIRHRDLKPDNFFIIGRNRICLGDFGSARCFGLGEQPLEENYLPPFWRGHIFYTAPETFGLVAENPESFRRADIYSLGTILFEMFTKQKLFPYVYDERFYAQIAEILNNRSTGSPFAGERLAETVKATVRDVRLPEIYDFGNNVPTIIVERLNRLYKDMANLNYEKRVCDFQVIFKEVDRCVEVLGNQKKYERWIALRKLWNERRKQNAEKGQSDVLASNMKNKTDGEATNE